MFFLGSEYKDKCPLEDRIPIWLIVSGTVALLQCISFLVFRMDGDSNQNYVRRLVQVFCLAVNIFQLVWFLIGSVWVYGNYEPNYDFRNETYCHKTVFVFSFWILNITYVVFCLTFFVSGLLFLFKKREA